MEDTETPALGQIGGDFSPLPLLVDGVVDSPPNLTSDRGAYLSRDSPTVHPVCACMRLGQALSTGYPFQPNLDGVAVSSHHMCAWLLAQQECLKHAVLRAHAVHAEFEFMLTAALRGSLHSSNKPIASSFGILLTVVKVPALLRQKYCSSS